MEEASERTPLTTGSYGAYGAPMYVFHPTSGRIYRSRIRHFQCCVCGAIGAAFVLAVVLAISYTINSDYDFGNDTVPFEAKQLQVLLTSTWPIPDASDTGAWPAPGPTEAQMEQALEAGREALLAKEALERAMPELPRASPSFRHQLAVATGPRANRLADAGYAMLQATKTLVRGMASVPPGRGPRVVSDWQAEDACAEEDGVDGGGFPACPPGAPAPWRSFDGRCANGPLHPWRGAAFRAFRRALPPAYADGVDAPRAAVEPAVRLPSAREVSVTVHRPQYKEDVDFSILLAVWGQFIDHDITATALSKKSTDDKPISCCYAATAPAAQKAKAHPECFPVALGPGDPYYEQYKVSCMEFVRSAPAPACRFGPREQLNQATSFLDASVVYGNSVQTATSLRSGSGGRLNMLVTADGRELLPESTDLNDGCNRQEEALKGKYCFTTGDARANENVHLTTMHLLLARQHNRLAAAMRQRNPQWGEERLFQEARRVVAAQMQHVTYNEFLPIILGRNLTEHLGLQPRAQGYSTDFDPDADPRVANVFAAAAFRFAHTLLPGLIRMINNASTEYVELHKVLFNPFVLYARGGEEATLRGALEPGLLRFDPHFSPQVQEHLFEDTRPQPALNGSAPPAAPAPPCGLDLVSLNIQRGRDHGLPAYPLWREHCGFDRPQTFDDLKDVMDADSLDRIAAIYKSVDDVDAYTGMLAEEPVPGALLGPTLTCIIADQFVRLKRGDRYWYETGEQPQAFTPEQLTEVRKTSLAQLLCDTSDAVSSIQRWVLRAAGPTNPRVDCASLPRADLDAWVDNSAAPGAAPYARVNAAQGGAGAGARALTPKGGKASAAAPIDAGTPLLRPLRVGAAVTSGRVTTADDRAWYASFPLELPLPLFDSVVGPTKAAATGAPAYTHGILWSGKLSTSSPGYLSLSGQFSLPKYVHGDALTNFSIEWLNGDFEFQLQVFWNTSDISAVDTEGSYTSPVYLGATKKYKSLQKQSANSLFEADGEFRTMPSLDISPLVKTAPIILLGTYSPDGTKFLWSGNVSAVIPDAVAVTPWSKSSYWSESTAEVPLDNLPWLPREPQVEALGAAAGTSLPVTVTVSDGNITVESNGTEISWWDGSLPVTIPMPAFNRVVKATKMSAGKEAAGKPTFASGVGWVADLQKIDNTTLNIQGNFSLPIFVHGPGALFSIEWYAGKFSLNFELTGNSTLAGVFQEGTNYSSPVFFRAPPPSDSPKQMIADMQAAGSVVGSAELQFVSVSAAETELVSKAPIILMGTFSPDKTQFFWSGNASILLPTPTGPAVLHMSAATTAGGVKSKVSVGALVVGGTVVGGVAGSSATTLWNGELPVPIRQPDLLKKGISWKGELTSTTLAGAQLEGTFSSAVPAGDPTSFPLALLQGKFSLQLSLLWNASVDGLLPAGSTVYSPIYLRGAAAPDEAEAWFSVQDDPSSSSAVKATEGVIPPGSVLVPIILQGAYSPDLTTFWWSGRVIMSFPAPVPALVTAAGQKAVKKLALSQSQNMNYMQQITLTKSPTQFPSAQTVPKNTFVSTTEDAVGPPFFKPLRLGAAVYSGSISTSGGSYWSGAVPLNLPLPLFSTIPDAGDSYPTVSGAPVFGHGVIWEGSLYTSSAGYLSFSGKFSMPRYTNGPGLTNFSLAWINGKFDVTLQVLWNTSDVSDINIQGTYSSPVFVGARKKFSYLQDVQTSSLPDVSTVSELQLTPAFSVGPVLKKAPIILLGTFSPDGTSFIWSGNVSIVIPGVVPVPTTPLSSLFSETSEPEPVKKFSPKASKQAMQGLSAIAATSAAMGVTVTGGKVSALESGSSVSWWDGTLPVSIPNPAFSRTVLAASKGSKGSKTKAASSFSSGVVWDATLERQDNVTLRMKGGFSFPIFVHGPGPLFSIDWKQGNFSLDFNFLWNTTLDGVFQDGLKYSSPVFFRAAKPTDTVSSILMEMQSSKSMSGDVDLEFVSAATADAAALPRAPIILQGTFSPDKTQFIWNGNATVLLPALTPPPPTPMVAFAPVGPPAKKVSLGGSVISGSLEAGMAGSTPTAMWNGELPVAITRPDILAKGISWKGQITSTSPFIAHIDGSFSTVLPAGDGASFPLAVIEGKFSAQISLLWGVAVDGLIPPDTTIYSPIYLRGAATPKEAETSYPVDALMSMEGTQKAVPSATTGSLMVPIILHGSYSPDMTTFFWSGRVIMSFPAPTPAVLSLSNAQKAVKKIKLTQPQKFPVSNAALTDSLYATEDESALVPGSALLRPLRVGATVYSGRLSTSSGSSWSASFPMTLPLPLFSTVSETGDAYPTVSGAPPFAHGVIWEGKLSSSYYAGYLSLSGKFSMPKYTNGPGLANFSLQWINGDFDASLQVLWNTSDISDINIEGTYSSPISIGSSPKKSALQEMPTSFQSVKSEGNKESPVGALGPIVKKAPVVLLGTVSPDKTSFLWSGNVSIVIPNAVPVPIWAVNSLLQMNGENAAKKLLSEPQNSDVKSLGAVPGASSAMSVTVTNGSVSALANGTSVLWWDGILPVSIPNPAFSRTVKAATKGGKPKAGKGGSSFSSGLVWDGTLEPQDDNVTMRLSGSFSFPIFVHGPGALFSIEWKEGNYSVDFQLDTNSTLDGLFGVGTKYSSPVFFRAAKPTDTVASVIVGMQSEGSLKGNSLLEFVSEAAGAAAALPRAPIILHGAYSPDMTQFMWNGNATAILPLPAGPTVLQMAAKGSYKSGAAKGSSKSAATKGNKETAAEKGAGASGKAAKITVGGTVVNGTADIRLPGSDLKPLWNGTLPVAISNPDLLVQGVTWTGQFTQVTETEVLLNGTFSVVWPGVDSISTNYQGNFFMNMTLLWNASVDGILPEGQTVFSPIYVRSPPAPKVASSLSAKGANAPKAAVNSAQTQKAAAALNAPMILQGTYSPDKTTFFWSGRVIIIFPAPTVPPPPPPPADANALAEQASVEGMLTAPGMSIGATVSAGSVVTADGTTLWDGSLPIDLPPKLTTVTWSGQLTPDVGGTVELRGQFSSAGASGHFSFVMTPLWSTPLTGKVLPGLNYTSPIFLREPKAPAPKSITVPVVNKVPIILQGTFSPDKTSFTWSGNVLLAFR